VPGIRVTPGRRTSPGNILDETDQANHVTHRVYDLAGRLTSVTRGGSTTSYTYYDDNRKQTETDPHGGVLDRGQAAGVVVPGMIDL